MADNEEETLFEVSSGNVFADLELDDADELNAKAQLAQALRECIRERGGSQAEIGKLIGADQSKVSLIMNGKIASFDYARLLKYLNALGNDVEIRISPRKDTERAAGIHVVTAGTAKV